MSCSEEEVYYGRQYITENRASVSLLGRYQGVLLDDHYNLIFTQEHIVYEQEDCGLVRADGSPSPLLCKKFSSTLLSKELNSTLRLDINISVFSSTLLSKELNSTLRLDINISAGNAALTDYSYAFVKVHDTNRIQQIYGANRWSEIVPFIIRGDSIEFPKRSISVREFPEYRVEDFQYDQTNETVSFRMFIHYHPDDSTDYELRGVVNLKVYQREVFTND